MPCIVGIMIILKSVFEKVSVVVTWPIGLVLMYVYAFRLRRPYRFRKTKFRKTRIRITK